MTWDLDINFGEGRTSKAWKPLQPQPTNFGEDAEAFGPEFALADSLLKDKRIATRPIALVKYAMGSTEIAKHWCPDGEATFYPRFLQFCRDSVASAPQPAELAGLFWFQGESDSSKNRTADAYFDNLVKLITSLRQDLAAPELPVVVSQVYFPGKSKAKPLGKINAAIEKACHPATGLGHAACCPLCIEPPPDTFPAGSIDDGHLTSAALNERGSALASTYLAMLDHM